MEYGFTEMHVAINSFNNSNNKVKWLSYIFISSAKPTGRSFCDAGGCWCYFILVSLKLHYGFKFSKNTVTISFE